MGLCNRDCNNCPLINHDNSRVITKLLGNLFEKFGDEVLSMTNDLCPNLTCCADCKLDDFCHLEGCLLSGNTEVDSEFNGPVFKPGDRVKITQRGPFYLQTGVVIKQILHHDGNEDFWGNVKFTLDCDQKPMECHCWQLELINGTEIITLTDS